MTTNPSPRPNRPGDDPEHGARLRPKSPNVAPQANRPVTDRERAQLQWLVGSIRERSLAA